LQALPKGPSSRAAGLPGDLRNLGASRDGLRPAPVVRVLARIRVDAVVAGRLAVPETYPVVFMRLADFSHLRLVERKMLFYRGAAGHGV